MYLDGKVYVGKINQNENRGRKRIGKDNERRVAAMLGRLNRSVFRQRYLCLRYQYIYIYICDIGRGVLTYQSTAFSVLLLCYFMCRYCTT